MGHAVVVQPVARHFEGEHSGDNCLVLRTLSVEVPAGEVQEVVEGAHIHEAQSFGCVGCVVCVEGAEELAMHHIRGMVGVVQSVSGSAAVRLGFS